MAIDVQKPKGPTKRSSPDAGGANPRLTPVLGTVKDNVDPTRSGRIFVYLTDNSGLDPDSRDNWKPVRFLSPYFGVTRPDAGDKGYGDFKSNPSSYGMWMAPPDIGTQVLCLFVDGDMNYGFYIGCVPDPEAMQMLPAIGATDNVVPNEGEAQSYGGALRLPVTNINTNNADVADSPDYLTAPKPVHSYSSAIMFQQGILRDPIRGPISSSSQRETPSRVGWGVSTPGRPIYDGGFDDTSIADNLKADKSSELRVVSRRGGHTIVMDDGDVIGRDQLVRIRTALGHQILMSDDGQTLMVLHSNGQSYIELGKEGTVDIYSTNSINLRTQGDLNLHADNNVNIHATKNLNIQGENIHINSEKEFKQRVGSDYSNFTSGKHLTKVGGAMSMESGGDISMASSGIAYVNGSKVNLNSGQTSTKPVEVPTIDKTLHTDTLFDQQKGFIAAPAKLVSITSRAPAHAPWANAGQGVDIKTDLNADSQLPASPSASVQDTNSVAASSLTNPVQASTTSSAPPTTAISGALDAKSTQAITGAVAEKTAIGPLKDAVTQGTAIAQTAAGTTVGVGKFGLTPTQLEKAGTLKPGSGALVTSLAAATGNVTSSMTKNLFTGQPGAENLQSLVTNVPAQQSALVKNLQQGQTALQNSGAITGAETATQLGGMVMSAAKNGVNNTLDAVKSLSGSIPSLPNVSVSGLDDVMGDIAGGNFAAGVGEGLGGALSGLESSLGAMTNSPDLASVINQAKGISAGAFNAIKQSFKPMKAGVPQSLSALAQESAEETLGLSLSGSTDALSQSAESAGNDLVNSVSGSLSSMASGAGSLGSKIIPNTGSIASSLIDASKSLSSVTGKASFNPDISSLSSVAKAGSTAAIAFASPSSLTGSLSKSAGALKSGVGSVSTLASGLTNMPGGASAVSSITNLAKGAIPSIPGVSTLKSAMDGLSTGGMNNLGNTLTAGASNLIGGALSQAGGLTSLLTKGLPAGAASALQSAMSSVASAGSGIKVPSIAVNTTDRSAIASAVTSQLGDPDIPPPKFGEIDEATKGKIEELAKATTDYLEQNSGLVDELASAMDKMEKYLEEYLTLEDSLPEGDPQILTAKSQYENSVIAVQDIRDKQKKLLESNPGFAIASTGTTEAISTVNTSSSTTITTVSTKIIKA